MIRAEHCLIEYSRLSLNKLQMYGFVFVPRFTPRLERIVAPEALPIPAYVLSINARLTR